ncbi:MAG: EcsC family protein [Pseudomonadota bacterium]
MTERKPKPDPHPQHQPHAEPRADPIRRSASSDAVSEVLAAQRAYEERRSTRFGRGAERLTAPLGGAFAKLVPPEALRAALRGADTFAGMTLAEVTAHDISDLDACEAAAMRVQAWAMGSNAATGAAAGWFGAAGMTADIPATIALAARTVRATGCAYGFAESSDEEAAFRLMILEAATMQAEEGRAETLSNLNKMAEWLTTPQGRLVMEKGGEWLTEKVIERVARHLGVSLAGRKAGQVVPIVGGAVAAVVNASFQTDIARAARYGYRQRWLMSRQLLAAPVSASAAAPAGDPV